MELERRHRFNPWTLDAIRGAFAARACVLLENEYRGSRIPMRYRCPSGHEYAQRLDHFVAGHGCLHCRNDRRWEGRRIDIAAVAATVEDEGFIDVTVTREHLPTRIRVEYTCMCGRRASTTWCHFRAGKRCKSCVMRGPNSPTYNHERTDDERIARRQYVAYYAWRTSVFQRDRYACTRCGSRGFLNAHHIVNFGEAPDLRHALSNGATLCRECHVGFHRTHGFRGNDADQLRSYIGGRTWV